MPEIKNTNPRIPKMAIALISRVPPVVLTNNIAVYIRPPIPRRVSNAPKTLFRFILLVLNMYIREVSEKSKYLKKPYNKNNHDHKVKDLFDFAIHRNESVDNP